MKTITFLLLTIFIVARLYSQSYEIDFAGTGDTTVVDSVMVENLNQDTSLTLNGNDVLRLNIITGIYTNTYNIKSLQVYPNPMKDYAQIQLFVNESSNVMVAVYDISGRSVMQSVVFLNPGMHKFRVSGLSQGIYTIRINEQNSYYTAKLISQNQLNGEAKIDYVSSENIQSNQTRTKQLKSTSSTIEMPYYEGDRLLFKGMTGSYSTIITDVPSDNNTITFDFMNCTDADDNHYPVVKIGTQTWMAENLKTTKYNDGTAIPLVTDTTAWSNLTTPGYCWYDNDSATYAQTYGAIYNWYLVDTASNGGKNVCPVGWHVPNDDESTILITYLGGEDIAGGKLKETGTMHWSSPNTGATNESGFTGLPNGIRSAKSGEFLGIGTTAGWLGATDNEDEVGNGWLLYYLDTIVYHEGWKRMGNAVRCMKD